VTSILDGSSTAWMLRTDAHPRDKLLALMKLAQDLRKTVTLEELLPSVLERLLSLYVQADRALIVLRGTGPSRPATTRACRHRGSERTSEASQAGKIVKEVMASGKAVVSEQGLIMSAPLLDLEGQPLGAVQLDALGSQLGFRREDLDLLTTVAFQVSVVVENANPARGRPGRALPGNRTPSWPKKSRWSCCRASLRRSTGTIFSITYAPAKYVGGDYSRLPAAGRRSPGVGRADVSGKGRAGRVIDGQGGQRVAGVAGDGTGSGAGAETK